MTNKASSPIFVSIIVPLVLLLGAGCGGSDNLVVADGTYADNTPFHIQQQAHQITGQGYCDSSTPKGPCVTLVGRDLQPADPGTIRGVRMDIYTNMVAPGMTYTPGVLGGGMVLFYFIRAAADGKTTDSPVENSGEIAFTSVTQNPGDPISGTMRNVALIRTDPQTGVDQTIMTLNMGTFFYAIPPTTP